MLGERLAPFRRSPGYTRFWCAATLARVANEMAPVGVVLYVLDRTGSAEWAGATLAAITLPSIVTGRCSARGSTAAADGSRRSGWTKLSRLARLPS